jgi:DNA-binding response OmpR family regulator
LHDFTDGHLAVDLETRRVFVDGVEVGLKRKEYDLLHKLVTNAGKALTRDQLLTDVWGGISQR